MIELRDVSMVYRLGEVRVPVLHQVTLNVPASQFLVIVGPSGSGKSTLLNIIGALDRPTEGRVTVADHELTALSDRAVTAFRRDHVGFVFQFYNLVPSLTAIENVAAAAELSKRSMDPADALDLVGLSDRARHFPAQLSGGEQQRVAVARALSKDPDLLLCDEPTGALDLDTGRRILAVLRRVRDELGKTVLLVTHNTAIADLADRVVRIGSGHIAADETNESPIPATEVAW
jgi:putative ABC transport system ATP-binding protein